MPAAKHNAFPSPDPGHGRVSRSGRSKPIELLPLSILSISTASEDHRVLREILKDSGWRIAQARTCREALARLSRRHMPLVICESNLSDGTWRDMLHRIHALASPPVLIVTSRLADDHLWAEVLNLGGYNVLAKPFRESEVKFMISSVWMREHRPATQAASAGTA
jgi:two-component system KDP operon response regulator KdpE